MNKSRADYMKGLLDKPNISPMRNDQERLAELTDCTKELLEERELFIAMTAADEQVQDSDDVEIAVYQAYDPVLQNLYYVHIKHDYADCWYCMSDNNSPRGYNYALDDELNPNDYQLIWQGNNDQFVNPTEQYPNHLPDSIKSAIVARL